MNKYAFLPAVLATSIVGFSAIAAPASAGTLVPQQEGEIEVGLGIVLPGTEVATPGLSITSLVDDTTGTKSRLFVDKKTTENIYGAIKFLALDAGTNDPETEYWFRPVALNKKGAPIEHGSLEVGTFEFSFTNAISDLLISFLDVEDFGTQILSVNGAAFNYEAPILGDNEISTYSLKNVSSIVLKLGNEDSTKFTTGDGVNAQLESVPEPGVTLGLSALALGGLLKLRRKQKEA